MTTTMQVIREYPHATIYEVRIDGEPVGYLRCYSVSNASATPWRTSANTRSDGVRWQPVDEDERPTTFPRSFTSKAAAIKAMSK